MTRRDEIRRVIGQILNHHDEKKISPDELTESFIAQYFDTSSWGDPDLLIRTSGELRVSNFLLWQAAYAELYFIDKFWPDFSIDDLKVAIEDYSRRKRNFGGR